MYNVFISYLREDKARALRLAEELASKGAAVWVDVSDLAVGAAWREEIAAAIRRAEFFLACFSSTYEERPANGMLAELNYVIGLRKEGQKYPEILPVKLNECDIPGIQIDSDRNLNELHWIMLDDRNWAAGVKQLAEITLKMAKERAKVSLRAEAEEVAVKNSELVRAQEELTTHQGRVVRQQVFSAHGQQSSTDWRRLDPPDVWPAQALTMRKMEYEYALAQYRKHQVEFVQRFGEDYHPLSEFSDKMNEEAKRIRKSFEDARRAEDAQIEGAIKGVVILFLLLGAVVVVLRLLWGLLRYVLGF